MPGGYDVTPIRGRHSQSDRHHNPEHSPPAQNIADTADNDLAATAPTGTDEPTFEMENTIPTFLSGTANGVLIVLTFTEELDPDSLPPGAAFDISTITTSVTVDNVSIAGTMVTLTVTPAILVDQHGGGVPTTPMTALDTSHSRTSPAMRSHLPCRPAATRSRTTRH